MAYVGTGITTGPYSLALNTSVTVTHPRTGGVLSTSVQIQNASGYALSVLSGTDLYTITAYQSTTIPVPVSGQGVVMTPTLSTTPTVSPTAVMIWLLSGQDPPQPDGPLTADAIAATFAGIVGTSQLQIVAATGSGSAGVPLLIDLTTATYPTGLSVVNFHSAVLYLSGSSTNQTFKVNLQGPNGEGLWQQVGQLGAVGFLSQEYITIPIPLTFGAIAPSHPEVYVLSSNDFTYTLILDQEVTTPGVVLGGVTQGLYLPVRPGGTLLQPIVAVERDGGSGVGSSVLLGASGGVTYWVTGVTLSWAYTTVSITGSMQLEVLFNGSTLVIQEFYNGITGMGSQVVRFADDGIPITPGGAVNATLTVACAGGITTLTGRASATMTYRQ